MVLYSTKQLYTHVHISTYIFADVSKWSAFAHATASFTTGFHKGSGAKEKNTLQRSLNIIFFLLHLKHMKGPADRQLQLHVPKQPEHNRLKLHHSWVVLIPFALPQVSGFHKLTNLQPGIQYPPHLPIEYYWATLPWSEMATWLITWTQSLLHYTEQSKWLAISIKVRAGCQHLHFLPGFLDGSLFILECKAQSLRDPF